MISVNFGPLNLEIFMIMNKQKTIFENLFSQASLTLIPPEIRKNIVYIEMKC